MSNVHNGFTRRSKCRCSGCQCEKVCTECFRAAEHTKMGTCLVNKWTLTDLSGPDHSVETRLFSKALRLSLKGSESGLEEACSKQNFHLSPGGPSCSKLMQAFTFSFSHHTGLHRFLQRSFQVLFLSRSLLWSLWPRDSKCLPAGTKFRR